jgi:mannitol/fructose-specific phosphotransferase system IIA component (Ntr-type)
MNLTRFLKEDFIDTDIAAGIDLSPEEGEEDLAPRRLEEVKQKILSRLVSLLERSGKSGNRSKLFTDIWNREKKATTAVGRGVAIPHVRTMQARDLSMAIGIAREGVPWNAPDGEPVRIFIAMVAPPYEDRLYLQVYQRIGRMFEQEGAAEALLEARSAGEVIRYLARAGE